MNTNQHFVFGIYPGGAAGGDSGLLTGPADDPAQIIGLLEALHGQKPASGNQDTAPFVVRCYAGFQDPGSKFAAHGTAPANYRQYAEAGRRALDLVLQFRSASGDVAGYADFVRAKIEEDAVDLYSVQITEEPNFADGPEVIDGSYPKVLEAIVEGAIAARETLVRLGRPEVHVGFNVTPTFGPAASFWSRLGEIANTRFWDSLSYVGLDFFPDAFRPVAAEQLTAAVTGILGMMREEWLPAAGIGAHVPIHITEHGWPTGPARCWERQAEVLEEVVNAIYGQRETLNIGRYMLFALRDVALPTPENEGNIFCFFGITAADYQAKPAFEVYRKLIRKYA